MHDNAVSRRQAAWSLHGRYGKQPFVCQMQQAAQHGAVLAGPAMLRSRSCSQCQLTLLWPCQRCLVHPSQLTLSTSMASGTSCCSKNMVALASTASLARAECPAAVSTSAHQSKPGTKPPRSITGAIRRAAVRMLLRGSRGGWGGLLADTVPVSAACLYWLGAHGRAIFCPQHCGIWEYTLPNRSAASECWKHRRTSMRWLPWEANAGTRHTPPCAGCMCRLSLCPVTGNADVLLGTGAAVQVDLLAVPVLSIGPCDHSTAAPRAPAPVGLPRQCSQQ